jgi:cytochrome b6-f complex iron-sulfur subunit
MLPATVAGRTVSVAVDPAGALGATGGVAAVETSLGPFLLARTGPAAFNVMTAVCTHEACTVSGYNGALFVCPCHNSKYTTEGTVANGPASQPLRRYTATLTGTTLTFTA